MGHMGICMSSGTIRDFAGPYMVGEGDMAFGRPTRYLQLNPKNAAGGERGWDHGVIEASETYRHRVHNLCCDNCHSHVATALDNMRYNNTNWNMVKLAAWMFVRGHHLGYDHLCAFKNQSLILFAFQNRRLLKNVVTFTHHGSFHRFNYCVTKIFVTLKTPNAKRHSCATHYQLFQYNELNLICFNVF